MKDLMKPRYEVIADYPNSVTPVNSVLTLVNAETHKYLCNGQDWCVYIELDKYPHLFRKLQWWEKRELSDMPEYVKRSYDYAPIKREKVEKGEVLKALEWHTLANVTLFVDKPYKELNKAIWRNPAVYDPATESDYLNFQQSKKSEK